MVHHFHYEWFIQSNARHSQRQIDISQLSDRGWLLMENLSHSHPQPQENTLKFYHVYLQKVIIPKTMQPISVIIAPSQGCPLCVCIIHCWQSETKFASQEGVNVHLFLENS